MNKAAIKAMTPMAPTPTPTPIPVFAPAVSPLPELDPDVSDEALEVDGAVSVVDVDADVDVDVDVEIDVGVGVEVADVTAYSTFQPQKSIAPTVELAVSVVVAIVNESESSEVDP